MGFPDRPFHNFGAVKSVLPRSCGHKIRQPPDSEILKRPVGLRLGTYVC